MKFQTKALQTVWQQKGFEQPTPIQQQTFEWIRDGKDVVAISPTGTGKTLAYLLPVLDRIEENNELQLLVVAPNQELAQQIGRVANEWTAGTSLTVQVLAGGANQKRQLDKLKAKPEIVIGTIGRLLELSTTKKLKLHQLQTVIVDEADYLMQADHLNELRELIKKAPSKRQLLFFSATNSDELTRVSQWFNTNPQTVTITKQQLSPTQTTHGYVIVPQRKRSDELKRLAHVQGMQALVFVKGRIEANIIAEKMAYHHIPIAILHSDQQSSERKQAVKQFQKRIVQFLIVTDVAARGLDLVDLPAVIHYDLPLDAKTYLHRSGRTGRMGKQGLVLSLVNERSLRDLKKITEEPLVALYMYEGCLVTERPERVEQKAKTATKQKRNRSTKSTFKKRRVKRTNRMYVCK